MNHSLSPVEGSGGDSDAFYTSFSPALLPLCPVVQIIMNHEVCLLIVTPAAAATSEEFISHLNLTFIL